MHRAVEVAEVEGAEVVAGETEGANFLTTHLHHLHRIKLRTQKYHQSLRGTNLNRCQLPPLSPISSTMDMVGGEVMLTTTLLERAMAIVIPSILPTPETEGCVEDVGNEVVAALPVGEVVVLMAMEAMVHMRPRTVLQRLA